MKRRTGFVPGASRLRYVSMPLELVTRLAGPIAVMSAPV